MVLSKLEILLHGLWFLRVENESLGLKFLQIIFVTLGKTNRTGLRPVQLSELKPSTFQGYPEN